jgi:hypothetical protein
VSILKQSRGERSTEKARSAGDHDPHACFNPDATSKIPAGSPVDQKME